MPLPGRHPRQAPRILRSRASRGRARAGNFRPGNFVPTVKLDTSHIHDMRVSSGTTAQLQARRAASRRKFTAR